MSQRPSRLETTIGVGDCGYRVIVLLGAVGVCGRDKVSLVVIEWAVPVGVAVGKLVLRVSGQPDIADAIGDAQEWAGWLQRSQKPQDVIGKAISDRLEKRLAAVTDRDEARDLGAAAQDVANLISRLADNDEAVRVAAAHPEQFLSYAKQHGGDNLRRLTSEGATPLFDQILEAAATEFADLAPSSSRFVSASLTEVLRQVEAMPEIYQNSRRAPKWAIKFSRLSWHCVPGTGNLQSRPPTAG